MVLVEISIIGSMIRVYELANTQQICLDSGYENCTGGTDGKLSDCFLSNSRDISVQAQREENIYGF
ncbi:hypothetical protein BHK98_01925 [Hornefia porci]|uniref:Uncharacterized protein n=1 Tax=Hornefia porci TaxID=2652292 RepID=A0A1Q9JFI4_9FIRM|nr:hypothetical protein BHK98_01925 [Hornefia porci]